MFTQSSDGTENSQQAKATTYGEADVDQDLLVAVKFFCENIDACTRLYTRKVLQLHGLEGLSNDGMEFDPRGLKAPSPQRQPTELPYSGRLKASKHSLPIPKPRLAAGGGRAHGTSMVPERG